MTASSSISPFNRSADAVLMETGHLSPCDHPKESQIHGHQWGLSCSKNLESKSLSPFLPLDVDQSKRRLSHFQTGKTELLTGLLQKFTLGNVVCEKQFVTWAHFLSHD